MEVKIPRLEVRQIFRNIVTGKFSSNFLEVLSSPLTLNPNFASRDLRPYRERQVMFKEIELVPVDKIETKEMKEIFEMRPIAGSMEESRFASGLIEKLMTAVERNWNLKPNHIVLHSSGRDSRVLSFIIRRLFNKLGEKWLGKVVFACSKWEGRPFKAIMNYEGWNQDQYFVVGENAKDDEVFAEAILDFKNAWRHCNGTYTNALNMFTYFPQVAHRNLGLSLEHLQSWSGFFSDEFAEGCEPEGGAKIKSMYQWLYSLPTYSSRPRIGEMISPYVDYEYLKFLICSPIFLNAQSLRNLILRTLDPPLMKFPNWNVPGHRKIPLANWVLKQTLQKYRKSWYGRKVQPNAIWKLQHEPFSPMMSYYTTASLCEHLLENGCKIKVDENGR